MDTSDAAASVRRAASKQPDEAPAMEDRAPRTYELLTGFPAATSGWALRLRCAALESPLGGLCFQAFAATQPGLRSALAMLREERIEEVPRPTSLHEEGWHGASGFKESTCASQDPAARLAAALHCVQAGGPMAGLTKCSTASNIRPTVLDYAAAYTQGMVTPSAAAERVIAFLEAHNAKQHWLSAWSAEHIRAAAAASTERHAAGKPLSVLDGVPFVVKDCIDALPYPTTCGTRFMGQLHPAVADAPCVAALKQLGAVLVGKAAMNELGVFGHGHNSHAGTTLNPHSHTRSAGGSSSGAAAAVAVGLCPIAIGADGGGSIRIPSSLCGVAGLKPTTGRLADDHGAHGGYSSVIVSGPIANSAADLTLLYAVMANANYPSADLRKPGAAALCLPGVEAAAAAAAAAPLRPLALPDMLVPVPEEAEHSGNQVDLVDLQPLKGLRVGVFPQWFSDCSPGVSEVVRASLAQLIKLGATRVDITLPDLDLVQAGHMATWMKEVSADAEAAGWLNDWALRAQLNLDTRTFFAMAANLTPKDYLQAQRMRARNVKHFQRAFEQCDVIITPATPSAATALPAGHDTTGVFDASGTLETVRFTQAANVTGLPAVVVPGGRQLSGSLPVGVQLMGAPFDEALLLRVAAALEQQLQEVGQPKPVPGLLINPIQCEKGAHPKAREMTAKLWASKFGKAAGGEASA